MQCNAMQWTPDQPGQDYTKLCWDLAFYFWWQVHSIDSIDSTDSIDSRQTHQLCCSIVLYCRSLQTPYPRTRTHTHTHTQLLSPISLPPSLHLFLSPLPLSNGYTNVTVGLRILFGAHFPPVQAFWEICSAACSVVRQFLYKQYLIRWHQQRWRLWKPSPSWCVATHAPQLAA